MSNYEFLLIGFFVGIFSALGIFSLAQKTKRRHIIAPQKFIENTAVQTPATDLGAEAAISELAQKSGGEMFND